jgi:hypothetical protein
MLDYLINDLLWSGLNLTSTILVETRTRSQYLVNLMEVCTNAFDLIFLAEFTYRFNSNQCRSADDCLWRERKGTV